MKDESRLIYSFYNNKQKNDLLSLMLFTCIILNNIYNITKMYIIDYLFFYFFNFFFLLLFIIFLLSSSLGGGSFLRKCLYIYTVAFLQKLYCSLNKINLFYLINPLRQRSNAYCLKVCRFLFVYDERVGFPGGPADNNEKTFG
jgi:hypothetical protein